ncbi:hypothetical protein KTT_32070 [Tengunoibacter tsumagoiensis]|uniref:Uncharacterized protein n=1 Tax=Tengunoibacter tsumagoiensis TaxID=2014871 RepID=A0A402A2G5_9CHLR|nr:hypothetical protein KTT_32070 [Tengunoibacter tsumagoiensis]
MGSQKSKVTLLSIGVVIFIIGIVLYIASLLLHLNRNLAFPLSFFIASGVFLLF